MKIKQTINRGVVLMHEDGKTFEMAPFQIFVGSKGGTIIRIGRNAFFFDKDGKFDGSECHPDADHITPAFLNRIDDAFDQEGKNRGLPPETPYFQPGTQGFDEETACWPNSTGEPPSQKEENYAVIVPKIDKKELH